MGEGELEPDRPQGRGDPERGGEDVVARLAGVDVVVGVDLDSRSAAARDAMTSLTFMLVDVPEPVWKTSIGNWSS